ncbi:MAG: hypothetical protein M3O03_02365 [Pseudomonadota bacterium]|nr:hypothetical protein [Pseudomonadota bacterium]
MATDEKQSIGQLLDNLKESIRLKWVELHEHLTSPEQRKVLRTEIKDAMAGLGKTLKQFDPRHLQTKRKGAPKKKSSPKKKISAKKKVRAQAAKKK